MSSTDSTFNSPFINNTIDLTINDNALPITNQELQQVLHCFPLNPKPARLLPDIHGLTTAADPLSPPRLSVGFDPTPDPDNNREYYILHAEDDWVCNSRPLMQTKVAGLLAALPDSERTSPEPHPIQPRLGFPSIVEKSGGGVEGGATGASLLEDEGEEAVATQATAQAHLSDLGPATEDEDVDLFNLKHPYILYSHFHLPGQSTL